MSASQSRWMHSLFGPEGNVNWCSSRIEVYLHPQLGVIFVVCGFVMPKGVCCITMLGRVDLQGGNSRPPWKSPPGAAAR